MKLQQLEALQAVVETGSFQAAAKRLNKSHPSVITSLKNLEYDVGFSIFDRSTYRATLTKEGEAFYKKSLNILYENQRLLMYARKLSAKEETVLNIAIGDVTPTDVILPVLKKFSEAHPDTQINLLFETINGPNERLLSTEADLIVHHLHKADRRYEFMDFTSVQLVPVAAPSLIGNKNLGELTYDDLKNYTQCIIRDTATSVSGESYHLLKGSHKITVGDQYTKREVIKNGLGWGHMPLFLVESDLNEKKLLSLKNDNIKNYELDIVIARRSDGSAGKIANKLWQTLQNELKLSP